MHLRDGALEVSHRDLIVSTPGYLFSSIIHRVELSDFIREANFFEQCSDLVSCSYRSEVVLGDTKLLVVRWEQ